MNFTQNCGCTSAEESKESCPHCGLEGIKVSSLTIESQIKEEKQKDIKSDKSTFNFCSAAKCPIVYYSNDKQETFDENDVRYKVTIKNNDLDTPLCYCKNLLKKDVLKMIENKEENIVEKIKALLFNGNCMCEQTNPKGSSCSEDLTIFLLNYGIVYDEDSEAYKEYEIMKQMTSCCGSNIQIKSESSCC